jgi:hypothetical protein
MILSRKPEPTIAYGSLLMEMAIPDLNLIKQAEQVAA